MKYRMLSIIMTLVLSLLVTSCSNEAEFNKTLEHTISDFCMESELPEIKFSADDYQSFLSYINYEGVECPFNELFGIKEAFLEKENRNFDVEKHTYSFFDSSSFVDSVKLYEIVKANNEKYMEGVGKHFNKELSNSKLKECCVIVADTLNWGIENIDGIDIAELGCILGNLKILNRGSMNLGTFNDKNDLLNISPDMIKSKKKRNGNSDMYEITVSHETMHILQCRCTDVEQSDDDSFIGTSYAFENLAVNPLKISWLYEASAELNTTLRFGCNPTTYQYMIDNLESISYATVLNDDVKARQLEKLCFTQDDNALYKQLEFDDKIKAAEFLYAIELLRNKPEDFKNAYEKVYGTLEEDYTEFLKKTYNPYFVEVVSKLLYKNLAQKLTQNEMNLNDIFYILSMYELDLLKDIPLDNPTVKEKYIGIYDKYIDMQKTFFAYIQKNTDVGVLDSFMEYQMNYENDSVYANASLEWLDAEKREYIIYRNGVLYDKTHKCILNY